MKRFAVLVVMTAMVFGCAPAAAPSGEPEGAPAPSGPATDTPQQTTRTIWDGVYTVAQAREGERVAQSQCTLCHTPQLEWPVVLEAWSNRPLLDMYTMIYNTMPQNNPGGLTREEYADVVAYMLQLTGAPAGGQELPSTDEGLARIRVTRPNQ